MRLALAVLASCAVAPVARAAAPIAPAAAPIAPAAAWPDPPRWRVRLSISEGFGGGRNGDDTVARFATTAELGARVWGPLSLDIGAIGIVAGEFDSSCGQGIRPSAIAGVAGLRADASNARSASWVDPFVEVHGGVGAQAGAHALPGQCAATSVFGTGGARAGLDVWLGRAAVTVALAFDYLPIGSTLAFSLGGSFKLF